MSAPICGRCNKPLEYGSVEITTDLLGHVMELCIKCAAKYFRMTEAQVRAYMDANDGEGTDIETPITTVIEIKVGKP